MTTLAAAAALIVAGTVVPMVAGAVESPDSTVFINEIHYDNVGSDTGEAIEVAVPAGSDLSCWSLTLYNGSTGASYATLPLTGVASDESWGYGFVTIAGTGNGIQNGSPDGIALSNGTELVQFLSYEGGFTAIDGVASGATSTDIGVAESSDTPTGQSLQLAGQGLTYGDFQWQVPAAHTQDGLNPGQSFAATSPPEPVACNAPPPDPDPVEVAIHDVQGTGPTSPLLGDVVIVEGVVVADFEGPDPNLRGFYLQEEDADADADPATSEGIFVFNVDDDDVSLGDVVSVTAEVEEFLGQTELGYPANLEVVPTTGGASVTPAEVILPFVDADQAEQYEGMLTTWPQDLYVTEYYQLGRSGELVVSSGDRLQQPTAIAVPGAAANAVQAANDLNRVRIGDNTDQQNPDTIWFGGGGQPLSASNPLRGGDSVAGLTGVLDYSFGTYRVIPIRVSIGDPAEASMVPVFESNNPRPTATPDVGGSLSVTGFNVLNYFLTLDDGGTDCGPTGFPQECRGANDAVEFDRQRTKLLAALDQLEADLIGLVELENTTGVAPEADLVAGLNQLQGAGTWDWVPVDTIGTDVIRVGMIYRTASVTPVGEHQVLDGSVDPRFNDDRNRPSLAQSFETPDGEVFNVVANHFKSKGSCDEATGLDEDQGDGQGCWNATRTAAAEALVDWLASDPTASGDDDWLVLGDLNAYDHEDPIQVLADAGYVDLDAAFHGDQAYSYVFDGQWGYLDYAIASPSLYPQVTGAAGWHINADEVPALDYNTDFRSDFQIANLYAPNQFRTSDHDPVVVGLELEGSPPTVVERVAGSDRIATSIALSQEGWDSSEWVILTRSDDYPDALAGAPLAAVMDAPILLNPTDHLDPRVEAEIVRLGASKVILLGGSLALGPIIEQEVEQVVSDGPQDVDVVVRIGGANRYDTAALIAGFIDDQVAEPIDSVVFSLGTGFADALAASSLATTTTSPILLVETDAVPTETSDAIADLADVESGWITGGELAVSAAVETELAGQVTVERLWGTTRYGTAAAIVTQALAEGAGTEVAVIASGGNWPDALSAGPVAWKLGGFLTIVHPTDLGLSAETVDQLAALAGDIGAALIAGGPLAISDEVAAELDEVLNG